MLRFSFLSPDSGSGPSIIRFVLIHLVLDAAGACGLAIPGGMAPAVWPAPMEPISPGAKQVTRPLEARRNCEGQSPLVNAADGPVPCDCTVNIFPLAFPATPTAMPGMS